MKNSTILILVGMLLMLGACNNPSSKKNNKSDAPVANSNNTKDTTIKNDLPTDKNIEESSYYNGFIIGENSLDFLIVGEALPEPIPSFVSYEISEKTIMEEGVELTIRKLIINDMGNVIIKVDLSNDDVVQEINIMSSVCKTAENIGVESLLSELIEKYSDDIIEYSYVNDTYFVTVKEYQHVQFVLNHDSYIGNTDKLNKSDLISLSKDEFNETAEVSKVRIF